VILTMIKIGRTRLTTRRNTQRKRSRVGDGYLWLSFVLSSVFLFAISFVISLACLIFLGQAKAEGGQGREQDKKCAAIVGVLKVGWVVGRAGNPSNTIDQSEHPVLRIYFEGPGLVTGLGAGLGDRSAFLHTNANSTFFHRHLSYTARTRPNPPDCYRAIRYPSQDGACWYISRD
jgi:hypothetical protein